jgi:hypothetical protein
MGGAISFTGMGDITCQAAALAQDPERAYKTYMDPDDCDPDGPGAETGSMVVGPGHYGLTSYNQVRSCTTNTTAKTIACDLDRDFIGHAANDIDLIWTDEVHLISNSSPAGVKFDVCSSSSLTYALGFRVNDILVNIDGYPTTSYEDGSEIFGHLAPTSYTGSPAVAKFYRSGNLWTMTVTRVNLGSYP